MRSDPRHDPKHPRTITAGGTYNQNVVCMAAAQATLERLWTPAICLAHNAKGDRLRARMNEVSARHGGPCQACGGGSLITLVWQPLVRLHVVIGGGVIQTPLGIFH
jgi:glutamate-1-semialdehyde aminotransferase